MRAFAHRRSASHRGVGTERPCRTDAASRHVARSGRLADKCLVVAAVDRHHQDVADEPVLRIIKLPDLLGEEEWRTDRVSHETEARRRYHNRVLAVLQAMDLSQTDPDTLTRTVLDVLFVVDRADGGRCICT